MDKSRFDTLARLVSAKQSRHAAFVTVLGAAVLGTKARTDCGPASTEG
jgi:hypothetical protein